MFLPLQIGIDVSPIIERLNRIMATQAENAAETRKVTAQLQKAQAEIIAELKAAADRLAAAVAASGNTSPEQDDALNELRAQAQRLDDMNPDANPADPVGKPAAEVIVGGNAATRGNP